MAILIKEHLLIMESIKNCQIVNPSPGLTVLTAHDFKETTTGNLWIAEVEKLRAENKELLEALKNLLTELPLLWGDHIKYGAMLLKLHNDDIETACELIAKAGDK